MSNHYFDDDIEFKSTNKIKHSYQKNAKTFDCTLLSKEEYNSAVYALLSSSVDNKKIFGYKTDKNQCKKYDKDLELLITYCNNEIISSSHMSWRDYSGSKYEDYLDEL